MTNPVTEILPRSGRTPDEVEMMTEFSLLIEEFVNFGTHVFKWEVEQARGGDENIPVQMMFRHILELADSVSILVKESSIDPCKLLLRGMLESVLGFEYLLEKDTHNRAMGFMVWHHHHKLKRYRMLNPKDKSSKDLSARLKADKVLLEGVPDPFIANLEERIQGLENLLSTPAYQLAESEYQKLLSKKIKGPKWHQLFGGPSSVCALSDHLNRQAFYEFLYRHWSGPTHGTDVFHGKLFFQEEGGKGNVAIVQIRFAKYAQEVVGYLLSLLLLSYQLMIDKRIPVHKQDFTNWYLTIRKRYREVISEKDLITIT